MSGSRVVIKVGSSTLSAGSGGIDEAYATTLVDQIVRVREAGKQPVLVSSGAIPAGLSRLGFTERPTDMPSLQAAASVGQVALIETYAALFAARGITVGQVLLTRHDTGHREAYLHARDTFERLLELGAVPIVNENDTVAVDEIRFGDNDTLAALVATLVGAELVIVLSDIDGLYDADPRVSAEATLLEQVDVLTDDMIAAAGGAGSSLGSGGMATKVEAARVLMRAGISMVVCDGRREGVIMDAVEGRSCGTVFSPGDETLGARKLWIALGRKPAGEIVIDEGAKRALTERQSSLLPAGVVGVRGAFAQGDAVVLVDTEGAIVARGLTELSADEVMSVKGMKSSEIAEAFPQLAGREVVHRDRLATL
ncbi:MAG TPA: glutamate 5-kinase [Coriobacteriia bacterium]|nr:glutamate 5-kinase [Coriobacteriia bacterium]